MALWRRTTQRPAIAQWTKKNTRVQSSKKNDNLTACIRNGHEKIEYASCSL